MESYIFWGTFLLVIVLGMAILFFVKRKKKGLSGERIEFYKKEIKKCYYSSASEKILRYDKILNHILKDFGYEGTLGEQLKKNPAVIGNIQEIWKLHKVRNQIAHELGQLSEVKLINDAKKFERELLKILEN
ncbi:MAG: hypothetical protein PHS92_02615 [Candidatus Gracilibacteria bacterium]|nr:hypothetical protein [Candidatus Gracilibacteria bacterium]